ncbi:MAG: alpha amylase C-terminal domain-containing protein, partial [Planctomycetes bacterium]|nr:alpha amylase C-terminal domain-containing protein [Planctomycetota bacterium]
CHDYDDSTLSFIRRAKDPSDFVVVALNFTPVPRHGFRLGVPENLWYQEIFNSDSMHYAGGNLGNFPGVQAQDTPSHGRPYSVELTLPPLATVVFKPGR